MFVFSLVILLMWREPGHPLVSLWISGMNITLTDNGLLLVFRLLLKALISMTFSMFFLMTTRYAYISTMIYRIFPSPIDQIFLMSYRFIFMRTPINLPLQWYKNIYILIILSIIMDSFIIWALQQVKKTNNKTGNRLLQISDLIDWSPIRSHLDEMYNNKSEKGGRPNSDVILMFKILILQQWFGLSDLEVERQISDRFSFMEFLGYPEPFPDSSTIWLFRERMAKTGKDAIVWAELQRQLDAMGLEVKTGTIQDATFIEADPGSSKKPRGNEAKTRRSRDGTWAKKGAETHFGYKLHQKNDIDYGLIREIETTTASLHDSQVDLSVENEVVLRDRGYFGTEAKGVDFTMKRRTTDKPLDELDKERNRLISKLRAPGERPHAVIKRVFNSGRVLVTTVQRVHIKMMVAAFAFDLYQLCTLKNAKVI